MNSSGTDFSKLRALLLALLFPLHPGNASAAEIPSPSPAVAPVLAGAPVAPKPWEIPPTELTVEAFPAGGLVIDTQDREAVRVFYRGLFFQSENVPMNWTGDYATCNAGTTDQLFLDAVVLRINWHRALAGIPANVSLYGPYNSKDQQAALMMSANKQLSHFPPSTWTCYTAEGYEAAGKSNLGLGSVGAEAVTNGYIRDAGSNNAAVGHRRWLLYPQTQFMGTGNVPGGTLNSVTVPPASTIWVLDSNYGTPRPATRDGIVAWPPKGYVPYPVVFGRWSLSYPNADFTNATLTVSKGGTAIPVSVEPLSGTGGSGFGENTIVWLLSGFNDFSSWPRPAADETYAVTVANVMVSGTPQIFSYTVTVFDPDVVTPGAPQATVTAPATAAATVPFTASVAPMANATGYQIDLYRSNALSGALTPANSAAFWTQIVSGYNALEATAFHLYHAAFATQQLTLDKALYVGPNASLSFNSWFGYATATEVATVQISLDGVSWQDLFSEAGTGSPTMSAPRTVNLAPFSGRMIRVRFVFTATSFYYDCTTCGWYFSDLAFTNVSELSLATWATLPPAQPSANLVATDPGNYILLARVEYQGTYFGDWGPGSAVQVVTADLVAPSVPSGLTAFSNSWNAVQLAWSASTDNVGVTGYQIFRGGIFRATVSAPAASFSDTSLTASTVYSYTVAACDAAGNCSAQSAAASATTLAAGSASFTPNLAANWNLLGNALNLTLDVATVFGGNSNVASVWKWDAMTQTWAYYSPALTSSQLTAFATSRAYQVLATIGPGEGYWVNALNAITLPAQSGAPFYYDSVNFPSLSSWNLIATASDESPRAFANTVSGMPLGWMAAGVAAPFLSLWAWDAAQQNWFYYAPALESTLCSGVPCGLSAVKSYVDARGLLHFEDYGKTLGTGTGFWVNR